MKKKKEFDMELRPHHVYGFYLHEAYPEWYKFSNKKYITEFRKQKGDLHSDKLIIHWKNTMKKLHKNPKLKFKYILNLDSVCAKCNWKKACSNKKHWAFKSAQKADKEAIKLLPELKPKKIYDGIFLIKLFKKKGWLK